MDQQFIAVTTKSRLKKFHLFVLIFQSNFCVYFLPHYALFSFLSDFSLFHCKCIKIYAIERQPALVLRHGVFKYLQSGRSLGMMGGRRVVLPSWQQSLRGRKMSTSNGEKIEFLHSTILKLLRPITGNSISNCNFFKMFAFSDRSGHSGYELQKPKNIVCRYSTR